MEPIQSIDAEDDQFAYRYDTQLLIDRRDKDLDEDEIADYITTHFEGNSLIAAGDDSWGAKTHPEFLLPNDKKLEFSMSFKGI